MKRLMTGVLFVLLCTGNTSAAGFDFRADFNRIPAGTRFQLAQQRAVFDDPHIRAQSNGDTGTTAVLHVVAEGQHGNCVQFYFPAGTVGSHGGLTGIGNLDFSVQWAGAGVDTINLELDAMFKPGFDLHSQGKTTNSIQSGNDHQAWIRSRVMWNGPTPNPNKVSHYKLYFGPLRGHLMDTDTNWNIVTGVWYHFHTQFHNGPDSHVKIWIKRPEDWSEILYLDSVAAGINFTAIAGADWITDFSAFFGGAGKAVAARSGSYLNIDNIHIYTGHV